MRAIILCLGAVAAATVASASSLPHDGSIYLDPVNGSDANSGTQAAPLKTIKHGLTVVTSGGTLLLAPGHYVQTQTDLPLLPKASVTIKGQGSSPEDVVIDAAHQGQIFQLGKRAKGRTSAAPIHFTLSDLSLVNGNSTTDHTLVAPDGRPVWKCMNVTSCPEMRGGAIHAEDVQLTLQRVHLKKNNGLEGGAIFLSDSKASLADCLFEQNKVDESWKVSEFRFATMTWYTGLKGGAILAVKSNLTATATRFEGNSVVPVHFFSQPAWGDMHQWWRRFTGAGGAVALVESHAQLTKSNFTGNTLNQEPMERQGGQHLLGNAVFMNGSVASFEDTTFANNRMVWHPAPGPTSTDARGGAVFAIKSMYPTPKVNDDDDLGFGDDDGDDDDFKDGGKTKDDDGDDDQPRIRARHSRVSFLRCNLTHNQLQGSPSPMLQVGGAVYAIGVYLKIVDSLLEGNVAWHGTIFLHMAVATISGTTFRANDCSIPGDNSAGGAAAAIARGSHSTWSGCTFEDNLGFQGGALLFLDIRSPRGWEKIGPASAVDASYHASAQCKMLFGDNDDDIDDDVTYNMSSHVIAGSIFRHNGDLSGADKKSKGGAICINGQSVSIKHSTFSDGNQAGQGGALYVAGRYQPPSPANGKPHPTWHMTPAVKFAGAVVEGNKAALLGDQLYLGHSQVSLQDKSRVYMQGAYRAQIFFEEEQALSIRGDSHLICPNGSLTMGTSDMWACNPCLPPYYTTINGTSINGAKDKYRCHKCPYGAKCETEPEPTSSGSGISAGKRSLVRIERDFYGSSVYHGSVDKIGSVEVHKCPTGFCCGDTNGTGCKMDSVCAGNRDPSVPLCGECKEGYTIAIDSPNCIPDHKCAGPHLYWLIALLSWLSWASVWLASAHGDTQPIDEEEDNEGEDDADADAEEGGGGIPVIPVGLIETVVFFYQQGMIVLPSIASARAIGAFFSAEWTAMGRGALTTTKASTNSPSAAGWCGEVGLQPIRKMAFQFIAPLIMGVLSFLMCTVYIFVRRQLKKGVETYKEARRARDDHDSARLQAGSAGSRHGIGASEDDGDYEAQQHGESESDQALTKVLKLLEANHLPQSLPVQDLRRWAEETQQPPQPQQHEDRAAMEAKKREREEQEMKLFTKVLWSWAMFCYVNVMNATLSLLVCDRYDDYTVLIQAGSHHCGPWQAPLYLVLFILIVLPLSPILYQFKLYLTDGSSSSESERERMLKRSLLAEMERQGVYHKANIFSIVKEVIGQQFKPELWYTGLILALFRLLLVLASFGLLIPGASALYRSIIEALLLMIQLMCQIHWAPYKEPQVNKLAELCAALLLVMCILHSPSSAWASIGQGPDSHSQLANEWATFSVLAGLCLAFPAIVTAVMVLPIVLQMARNARRSP